MNYKLELYSASELGQLVNERKIKPSEVIEYFKNRILERNHSINAFVYTKFDEAMELALKQDQMLLEGKYIGPFAGVPFGLKDFLTNKPGWSSSHGGVPCLVNIDESYSVFCKAMEDAGGIPLGKTNAPSYGFRGTTDNKMYGVTKTPFNLKYNSGGSSGGSAASVSDGLVLISEGGDAGGSIRIPACFCNLYGFKAGIGTIPSNVRPDAYSCSHPYCFNGGLTKTVEDTAILLKYMSYFDPRDPNSRNNEVDYVKEMHKDISKFKIAYTEDFDLFEVDQDVKECFKKEIEAFKKLGIPCEEVKFNFKHNANQIAEAWCKGITVDCAIELNLLKQKGIDLIKDHQDDFPEEFIYWKNKCDSLGIMDLYDFNLVRSDILDQFENVFEDYDFILSPVSSVLGILNEDNFNTKGPSKINGKDIEPLIGWTQTFLANFTGNPACSIPGSLTKDNLPFGIQIIGKRFNDGDVLALSYSFEKLKPWKDNYLVAFNRKIK